MIFYRNLSIIQNENLIRFHHIEKMNHNTHFIERKDSKSLIYRWTEALSGFDCPAIKTSGSEEEEMMQVKTEERVSAVVNDDSTLTLYSIRFGSILAWFGL